jgi:DNA-binding NarL/FixJ family response regulator
LNQWTRSQRIRTAAAIPVTALIVDSGSMPVYLEIGEKAVHLRELGMSDKAIARALNVSDKTAAKAIHLAASDE